MKRILHSFFIINTLFAKIIMAEELKALSLKEQYELLSEAPKQKIVISKSKLKHVYDTQLEILPYTPKDKPLLIQALIELQEYEYNLSDTRKPPYNRICSEYFEVILKEIQTRNRKIFAAILNGKFAGFISYLPVSDNTVFEVDNSNNYILISDVCILKKFRRKGIAKSLFEKVFTELHNQGFKGRIRICALANNDIALRAYKKFGFKPYEVIYEKSIK